MRKLLLLLFAASLSTTASAQWTSQGAFPADTFDVGGLGIHGVAVDADGQVYLQPFAATDSVSVPALGGAVQTTRIINVYEPDGSLAETIKFLTNEDGTPGDTLGGFTTRDGTGAAAWEGKSGRGLASGPDGNIFVSQFNFLYELDHETNRVVNQITLDSGLPSAALTAPSITNDGTVYVRAVFAGESVIALSPDFTPIGDAYETDNFSRTILAAPEGNTIYATDYENPYTIVYQRADEFSPFDSVGVTLRGMRVESVAINPVTGNYWFSSGNATDNPVNQDSEATRNWFSHTWYGFTPESLLASESPAPVDSLSWYECEFGNDDDTTPDVDESFLCFNDGARLPGKPRGIAFSPDGNSAYVVLFSQANAAAKYTRMTTSVDGERTFSGALAQNRPNPFSGSTEVTFELDQASTVSLRVYDTTGRQVATLADGAMAAGPHSVTYNANGLSAGVYVYVLNVDGAVSSRRMMVVR